MLPCTAPPPPSPGHHPPLCALLHLPLLPLPAPAIHSSSHTAPSVSCAITTHILPHLLFGSPCHLHGLWTPLSLPCLLQNLHFPWGPLLPHPFRLQLSPGSPPPWGPLRACCLCSCCLFILCTFLFPVGLSLGGTEPRQLPGEQERARKQEHTRREKRARWSGGRWGQGPGEAGVCGGWGK